MIIAHWQFLDSGSAQVNLFLCANILCYSEAMIRFVTISSFTMKEVIKDKASTDRCIQGFVTEKLKLSKLEVR